MLSNLPALSARERQMLIIGSIVLLVLALYAFTYQPIIDAQQRIHSAIETQQTLHQQLQAIASQAAILRSHAPSTAVMDESQSLLGSIELSSDQANIKACIQRLTPEGQDKVALWVEHCDFDKLMGWLIQLDQQYAIFVQQTALNREPNSVGLATGKITLTRSPSL